MIHIIFTKKEKWVVMSDTTIYGSWKTLSEAKLEKRRIEFNIKYFDKTF